MTAPSIPYTYNATVLDVHDGDTVKVGVPLIPSRGTKDQDLGFHIYVESGWIMLHLAVRLIGINAPELATDAGKAARTFLLTQIQPGSPVQLRSKGPSPIRPDKYGGRWDGVLMAQGVNLNDLMVTAGHAMPWNGVGVKPIAKSM